ADEHAGARLEVAQRVAGRLDRALALEELLRALGEHRVVDRVLRVEVRVQRRGLHPHPAGQVAERQGGQTLVPYEVPGGGEDLGPGGLTPFGPPISLWSS